MNPITMDNYGSILYECGFINILPKYIIKYHTLVKSRTISQLKKEGLLNGDIILEQHLQECFKDWPDVCKSLLHFRDTDTSILTVRMSVLERYLTWKLSITNEEFQKYCKNYLPLKHKPMADIQEALELAENEIRFDTDEIRRNGFIISSDPINTKLIIENVPSLAGFDIRDAIKIEPAILKNNYNALLKIRNLLEEYRISEEAQRHCLKVYCMRPSTVQKRLDELGNMKEYQILHTNPRVLSMVVHKNKMVQRLSKIEIAKKQCYSLNHLVSSSKVFNDYITSFGNKVCGRDISILICTSLKITNDDDKKLAKSIIQNVHSKLRRHKYYLYSSLHVIAETIEYLKKSFDDKTILDNCHLLLYPICEIELYLETFLKLRNEGRSAFQSAHMDASYNNIKYWALTDEHILSLVLYEIEKKYHFSGDGIWARQDGVKLDSKVAS
ncbi:transcription termination factor 5, mitochondrial-like isoform X2 [Plodia interpunctella]|nr:transcription termination factor 5, mitochondrial-like isoform X2 [Plodia interpunctella]